MNYDKQQLLNKLEGLTVALATPLTVEGALDVPAFSRLIEYVIGSGAAGVFALGWMGEQPCLSDREREKVMHETVRLTAGRVPTIFGVSEQSLPRALALADLAKKAGADIILSTAPYSYPVPQRMVYEYFRILSIETAMPVIAYHNDETSVPIAMETVVELSELDGMLGIKDYSNFVRLQKMLRRVHRPGSFAVFAADEYLYGPALMAGATHFTMGGPGNIVPGWCVKMGLAAKRGDWADVVFRHQRIIELCETIYPPEGSDSSYTAIKYALSCMGICRPDITPPLPPMSSAWKKVVDKALEGFAAMLNEK